MDRTTTAVVAGLTITAMAAAADMFGRALPSPFELAERPVSDANTARVRQQCARCTPLVAAIGVGASLLARSWWPVLGVAAVAAWMCWQYDDAARRDDGQVLAVAPAAGRSRYA